MATLQINIECSTEQIVAILADLGETTSNGHAVAAAEPAAKAVAKATRAAKPAAKAKTAAKPAAKAGKRSTRRPVEEEEIIDEDEEDEEDEDEDEDEEVEEDDDDEEGVSVSEEELEEMSLPELRKFAKDQGLDVARNVKKPDLIAAILDAGEEADDDDE